MSKLVPIQVGMFFNGTCKVLSLEKGYFTYREQLTGRVSNIPFVYWFSKSFILNEITYLPLYNKTVLIYPTKHIMSHRYVDKKKEARWEEYLAK